VQILSEKGDVRAPTGCPDRGRRKKGPNGPKKVLPFGPSALWLDDGYLILPDRGTRPA